MENRSGADEGVSEKSRQRFMAAADRVFLEHGYSNSTIRLITAEAKTSLARLNRHWTGKEQLFEEVFARHFTPIHAAQHKGLDEVVEARKTDDIGAVVEAFLTPAMMTAHTDRVSHLIYCKALVDPADEAKRIVTNLVRQVYPRVVAMLREALPGTSPQTFFFVVSAVMGAYVHSQTRGPQIAQRVGIDFEEIDWANAGKIITGLLVNGLKNANNL